MYKHRLEGIAMMTICLSTLTALAVRADMTYPKHALYDIIEIPPETIDMHECILANIEQNIIATTEVEVETTEQVVTITIDNTEIYQPTFTDDDILLLRVASCEAGNQGIDGMALVMNVVINRSNTYGCSIHDVIYAPEQFACINTHWWWDNYIADGAYEALAQIKNGVDNSQGALYFCTPSHNGWHSSHLTYLFTFGGHEFYK